MFIAIELQTNSDGTVSMLTDQFQTQNEAESKFHTVLGYAATSALPKHSCVIITEEGFNVRHECYRHNVQPTPTPEPEEDEEE